MSKRKCVKVMDWINPQPRELDNKPCPLFDDFPYVSIQEKVLKAQAAGVAYDDYIRKMYLVNDMDQYDPESYHTDLDDAENGADAIESYRQFMRNRRKRDSLLQKARFEAQRMRYRTAEKGDNEPSKGEAKP